jgi:predicted NACHT family NTPase
MVLGKPGSGKTTFLRHLAVDCSKGKFFCDRIPVLIELRSIKEGNSFNLLNLIHREFGLAEQEQTLQILNQGKAFILLDGLDEVPSQLRQSVRDQIYEFAKEYRKNRFVLTCRTQTIEYIADHFEPIEVANFDAEQVKIFASNWFTATPETSGEAEGWTSRFVGKLEENKQIRELAVTPILLTLTCLLFTAEQDLPTKRSEMYEKGSNLLLQQWDKFREIPRDYQQLSVSDKQKLLSYLAFRKFEQPDNFILFEQDEIQGYIAEHLGIDAEESETVLKAIEAHHGLLIEIANGIWSFSHLTFQEYFAAKHIVDSLTPEAALQSLVAHITEPRWREVFLLAVEMLPIANDLLQLMKRQIDVLLVKDEKLQQFLVWLNPKSLSVELPYQPVAIRAFYLGFVLNFGLELSRVLDCDLDLDLAVNRNPDHLYALGLALALAFTLSLDHASSLACEFSLDLRFVYNFARDPCPCR